jgi:hypothetical protein
VFTDARTSDLGQFSIGANRWDEKAGLERDALSSQVIDALEARETRRPAMKKLTTTMMQETHNKQDRHLTVGLDLGDRSSFYCVLDEAGDVLMEQRGSSDFQRNGSFCRGYSIHRLFLLHCPFQKVKTFWALTFEAAQNLGVGLVAGGIGIDAKTKRRSCRLRA